MAFLADVQAIKTGLILFRRTDVKHTNWYCRIKLPKEDRYKVISLKTPDLNEARDKALEQDADIRFRLKHGVPIFEKSFADVAMEYSRQRKEAAQAGQLTMRRWRVVDAHIRLHLIPYMGNVQIVHVREDSWRGYPIWRKQHGSGLQLTRPEPVKEGDDAKSGEGKEEKHLPARDGTIRQEMMTFRAIMNYAVSQQYIREGRAPKGRLLLTKARREEFTP
ncbi:MAG TPA: site-specific integrase, partial [bacterium]